MKAIFLSLFGIISACFHGPTPELKSPELTGNLSLNQELKNIKWVNQMIESHSYADDYIKKKKPQPIDIYIIPMSKLLQKKLDLPSKLDRSLAQMTELMGDGIAQGELFIKEKNMFKEAHSGAKES